MPRRILTGVVAAAVLSCVASSAATAVKKSPPRVQMAILLDTSNSMDGLIDQARTQLWRIVNEFIDARKDGQRPRLEVALYEYGNSGLSAEGGYIRQVLPFTDDLDKVSEMLFALKTNGGSEHCGQVIERATEDLAWSAAPEDLRVIFIAGNEPFTQGPVEPAAACRRAIARSITVNTIHCGPDAAGVATGWRDGALLADGTYLSIDQNQKVAHVDAPQDAEIARLGVQLNETYLPYGSDAARGAANQSAQDANAAGAGAGTAVSRAVAKASENYLNASWDLVDAVSQGRVKIEELKSEELPEAMKKMGPAERRGHLDAMAKARQEIQQRVTRLNQERTKYVEQELRKRAAAGEETLDSAIIKTVREQATRRGFGFEPSR
jgi:hypothetical protein